jgi:hypothetical protein
MARPANCAKMPLSYIYVCVLCLLIHFFMKDSMDGKLRKRALNISTSTKLGQVYSNIPERHLAES